MHLEDNHVKLFYDKTKSAVH